MVRRTLLTSPKFGVSSAEFSKHPELFVSEVEQRWYFYPDGKRPMQDLSDSETGPPSIFEAPHAMLSSDRDSNDDSCKLTSALVQQGGTCVIRQSESGARPSSNCTVLSRDTSFESLGLDNFQM